MEFRRLALADKPLYEQQMAAVGVCGCDCGFGNLYLWGEQEIACVQGQTVIFSRYGAYCCYHYPLGEGDRKAALDAIIDDAAARGVPCRLVGLYDGAAAELERLYPGQFSVYSSPDSDDYVYDIHDLADLPGRKYHRKRNHLRRFEQAHPGAVTVPLTEALLPAVRACAEAWYAAKAAEHPDMDTSHEHAALNKALECRQALGMEALVLLDGEKVLAFTCGSRLAVDMWDVQFEKALPDADGAYPAINRAFARHIRSTYPQVRFLNREEDMGIEALRKAKHSYYPHHMLVKLRARRKENT